MAKVLIVDDHQANRELFVTLLGYAGHRSLEARNGVEALEIARAEYPDLVITDILMPRMDGFTLVRRLRTDPLLENTSVIFQTAHYLDKEIRGLAADCGVHYILVKPVEPQQILKTVSEALSQPVALSGLPRTGEFQQEHLELLANKLYQKVSELETANAHLRNLSLTDDLTGLNNRRGFMLLAEELLKYGRRTDHQMCLLYMDLDGLKHINDTFGHAAGDTALRDTARILTETFREADVIARLGGDEFGILAMDVVKDNIKEILARLGQHINAHNAQSNSGYALSLSPGVIHIGLNSTETIQELLSQADAAMYTNKQQKKNHKPKDKMS
jgi:diguanylate cyclase (GGDEF)-like protein